MTRKVTIRYSDLVILCDDADYLLLSRHRWYLYDYKPTVNYAQTCKGLKVHQLLLPSREGFVRDHINRNGLDNRRCNLRYATACQSMANRGIRSDNKTGTTGVKVRADSRGYQAQITVERKRIHLGTFTTLEAAKAARRGAEARYLQPKGTEEGA